MSTQIFACPRCAAPFQVDANQPEQHVQCPACSAVIQIPDAQSPTQPAIDVDPFSLATPPPIVADKPVEINTSTGPALRSQGVPAEAHLPCPHCKKPFHFSEDMPGTTTVCPHCKKTAPTEDSKVKWPTRPPEVFVPQSVDHLLPPKFEAVDPAFFYRHNRNDGKVLLPSADGSVQTVNNRIVTVIHNGKEYQLISSPRYRQIQTFVVNAVMLVIATLLIVAIYFTVK